MYTYLHMIISTYRKKSNKCHETSTGFKIFLNNWHLYPELTVLKELNYERFIPFW